MVVLVCLHITLPHYHHYANLSEGMKLLQFLSGMFCLEWVSKIKSILSIIFHAIYGAVRIQLTYFYYDDCENTCTLSYWHHQIRSMTIYHCLGLGHETMVCAVCLFKFLLRKHTWVAQWLCCYKMVTKFTTSTLTDKDMQIFTWNKINQLLSEHWD